MAGDKDLSEDSLKGLQALIDKCKKQHEQLLQEQKDLSSSRDDADEMVAKFTERTEKMKRLQAENDDTNAEKLLKEKKQLEMIKMEEEKLKAELQKVQATLEEEETNFLQLQEKTEVFASMPERNVVFTGQLDRVGTQLFDMKAHIVYPMDGGTAFMTFQDEKVAQAVVAQGKHVVQLGGDCRITVEASPFHLLMPDLVEIDTGVCPRRVLISDLPDMDTDTMLNKLEIHFSKRRNGGGEVFECVYLEDSRTVVISFVDEIAKDVTSKEFHDVLMDKKKTHRVRATPFLNGEITNLKTEMQACRRTVLLSGIPDVMEAEEMQDQLEIHFQKTSNGGGEIAEEAFMYNAQGQQASAVFQSSAPRKSDDQQVVE